MKPLNITSIRQNRTVHTATLDEPTLLELARKVVAEQLGVDLGMGNGGPTVEVKAHTSSYQEGSLGTSKTSIKVEMIVHEDGAEAERSKAA